MRLSSLALVTLLAACSSGPTAPLDAAGDGYRISVGVYEFSATVPQGPTSRRWNGTLTITAVTNTGLEGEWDANGLEPALSSTPDTEVGRGRFLVKGFGNIVDPLFGDVERFSLEMMLVPVRDSDVVDCTELVWRRATVVAQPGECSLILTQGAATSVGP
ncbi:MAG: hypothetical protein R3195_20850 [Gemmatimonadota bacterium]|nr:hypothetical protein [Gemmatimonadota bacterium]